MPQPINIQYAQGGQDLAAVDTAGNFTNTGAVNVGTYVSLPVLATAPTQVPGNALLYSPDGSSVQLVQPSGAGTSLVSAPVQALTAPVTVTGTVAKTTLFAGPTTPAVIPAGGAIYRVVAWGVLTTTLAAQTVQFEIDLGATQVFTWSTQQPNSGGTVTAGAWKLEIDVNLQSNTVVAASGWDGLNFFFSSLTQANTTVANTRGQAMTLALTNSATAVSVTCNGCFYDRIA